MVPFKKVYASLQTIKARKADFSNVVLVAISKSFDGQAHNLAKLCLNTGNDVPFSQF